MLTKNRMMWTAALALLAGVLACSFPSGGPTPVPASQTPAPVGTTVTPTAQASATPQPSPTLPPTATATPGPVPIRFPSGATSTTVQGTVPAGGEAVYTIYALQGQTMTLTITAPPSGVALDVSGSGQTFLRASEGKTSFTFQLPASQEYRVGIVSTGALTSFSMDVVIPPLACNLTPTTNLTVYRWSSAALDVFGTMGPDLTVQVLGRTSDGWYGFDPAVAQAGNIGFARLRWVKPGAGQANTSGNCASVPLVFSADQLRNLSYQLEGVGLVKFTDGEYSNSALTTHARLLDLFGGLGDLNGDGLYDAAVVTATNTGGSGTFIALHTVLNVGGTPTPGPVISIGDREAIHTLAIDAATIIMDATIHSPSDPLCCPSVDTVLRYQLSGGALVEVAE